MEIVHAVIDEIPVIRTVIEILNGFAPEAPADFIKDIKAYNEKFNTKNTNINNKTDDGRLKKPSRKNKKSKKSKNEKNNNDDDNNEDNKDNDNNGENDDENDPDKNRGEIKILTTDPNQVMIASIVLKGSAFRKFKILPDKYSVGLNLDELYRYIKNVDKDGTLHIRINSDDTQHIIFNVQHENIPDISICELRVLNLANREDRKIEANVAMSVRIKCAKFHKVCKDLFQFSKYVEITCDPSQLVLTCKGDLSNHSRIFKADGSQDGIAIKTIKRENDEDQVPNIIRLIFDLQYINYMYKCSGLCEDMEIYLNSDSVMFLKYGIKLMGEMIVGISPCGKKKESMDNYNENDELYYQDDEEIMLI